MKRTTINYSIDVLILISVFLCSVTGIVKWPGLIPNMGLTYNKMPMAAINALHDWSGLAVCILAAIHIFLHWKWLVTITLQITLPQSEKDA